MPRRVTQGPGGASCERSARDRSSWPVRGGRQTGSAAQAARGRADCSGPWPNASTGGGKPQPNSAWIPSLHLSGKRMWREVHLVSLTKEGTMYRTTTPLLTLLLAAVAHAQAPAKPPSTEDAQVAHVADAK